MSTKKVAIIILSEDGTREFTEITWSGLRPGIPTEPITLRVFNAELDIDTTSTRLNVIRGDLRISDPPGEEGIRARSLGSELVGERWLEARVGTSGPWTSLDEFANFLALGGIPAQGFVTVQMRLNPPADAISVDEIGFCIAIRSRTT